MTTPLNKRVGQWWLNLLFWHARHAPAVPMALRPLFVWGTWIFSSAVRRGTLANAARLLDGHVPQRRRRRLARAVIGNFYDAVVEFGLNRRRSPEQLMALLESVQGEARYLETRRGERGPGRGRGAILVTAHIGSFEVAMAMLRSREPRVHVLFRRDELPLFEELRTAQHARLGVLEAPVEEGLATWAGLRDALAADEVVLMQGDRVMPGQPGVTVPFLGGHARMPSGPVKLARLTGAPLIPVFAINTPDRRIRIEIGEPIRTADLPLDANAASTIDPALLRVTSQIERVLREHPDQWLRLDPALIEDAPTDARAESPRILPDDPDRDHRAGAGDLAGPDR